MKNLFKFIKQKQQLPPNHHRHIALTLAECDGAISDGKLFTCIKFSDGSAVGIKPSLTPSDCGNSSEQSRCKSVITAQTFCTSANAPTALIAFSRSSSESTSLSKCWREYISLSSCLNMSILCVALQLIIYLNISMFSSFTLQI